MTVLFEDFLISAEKLLKNNESKEIDFRNLISRSYYALFHLSKEIAKPLPQVQDKNKKPLGSHEKIFIKFEKHTDGNLRQLGYKMTQLKKNRCKADYEINKTITLIDAKSHFKIVQETIKKLQQLQTTT